MLWCFQPLVSWISPKMIGAVPKVLPISVVSGFLKNSLHQRCAEPTPWIVLKGQLPRKCRSLCETKPTIVWIPYCMDMQLLACCNTLDNLQARKRFFLSIKVLGSWSVINYPQDRRRVNIAILHNKFLSKSFRFSVNTFSVAAVLSATGDLGQQDGRPAIQWKPSEILR